MIQAIDQLLEQGQTPSLERSPEKQEREHKWNSKNTLNTKARTSIVQNKNRNGPRL